MGYPIQFFEIHFIVFFKDLDDPGLIVAKIVQGHVIELAASRPSGDRLPENENSYCGRQPHPPGEFFD